MTNPVYLALCSMILCAVNDLIYRKAAIEGKTGGIYFFYFVSSVSSVLCAFFIGLIQNGGFEIQSVDILYGAILGLLSFGTYMLFLLSFNGSSTTVTVTIYRLNMIPGIILAVIFLGERITLVKGMGIFLCIVGMLILSRNAFGNRANRKSILLSVAACLGCGVINMFNKAAIISGADAFRVLFWRFLAVAFISGLIFYHKRKGKAGILRKDILMPMISGLLLMLAIYFTLVAFKTGDVSVVIPISQFSFVIVSVISWLMLKEAINARKIIGVLCSVIALVLIGI